MAVSKFRIRFKKAGDLRFLSHHDLMRLFERMLRRAALPFRSTEGFHPKPKMAFASALALGVIGHQEVVEIEFEGGLTTEEVRDRLAAQAQPGLDLLTARRIDPKVKAQACRARYWLPFDCDRRVEIAARLEALLHEPHCWVERSRPQPRRVNIKPYFVSFDISRYGLRMVFRVTPQGTARPEEVVALLGLGDLLHNGAVLERTALELADEPASSGDAPQDVEVVHSYYIADGGAEEEPDDEEAAPSLARDF